MQGDFPYNKKNNVIAIHKELISKLLKARFFLTIGGKIFERLLFSEKLNVFRKRFDTFYSVKLQTWRLTLISYSQSIMKL